jgi:hypothetical protein
VRRERLLLVRAILGQIFDESTKVNIVGSARRCVQGDPEGHYRKYLTGRACWHFGELV